MRRTLLIISFFLLLASCKKEKDPEDASIIGYAVTDLNQSVLALDVVYTEESEKCIYLLFNGNFTAASFPLEFTAEFSLTEGAVSLPASGETVSFNNKDDRFHYIVTASDGNVIDYYVVLRDNQIPDSDFEDWYLATGMDGRGFYEPGLSAEATVWATANQGTSTFGLYCTTPYETGDGKAVRIVTGETSLIPVTAGTLFTGKFDVDGAINNPTDPKKATDFGMPFSLRPNGLSFRYSFQPGARYIRATLKNPTNIFGGFTVTEIEGNDSFTAYAVLERRDSNGITEVARAELISDIAVDQMTPAVLPFAYSSDQKPTHLYVVFASSKDGDLFTGAVGSTLFVDDVELLYQE